MRFTAPDLTQAFEVLLAKLPGCQVKHASLVPMEDSGSETIYLEALLLAGQTSSRRTEYALAEIDISSGGYYEERVTFYGDGPFW